jgi:hypothetical protein
MPYLLLINMPSTLTLRYLRPSLDEKIDAWSNVIIISGAMISAIYALGYLLYGIINYL